MDHKALKAFREMVGLPQHEMARLLGYKLRNYQWMESGTVEIRHGVGLACAAYALGITHYDGKMICEHWKATQKTKKGKR